MIEKLMHKYALSKQGASDMIKAIISATISNIILMVPVALLYYLVRDYMAGNCTDPQMLDQKSNDWRSIFLWLNIVLNLKRK